MDTIQDKLLAWGRSRLISSPPNAVKPPGWVGQIQNPGEQADRLAMPPLGEDEHIRVDAAVSELKNRKPDHHRAIVCAYQYRMNDNELAKRWHWFDAHGNPERRSRSWVRSVRENAEHWLDGKLG